MVQLFGNVVCSGRVDWAMLPDEFLILAKFVRDIHDTTNCEIAKTESRGSFYSPKCVKLRGFGRRVNVELCTPAIAPYTHATCIRRRHMVYYHIIWLASKSNSPLLVSDQSTVELCIPASICTCANTNHTMCVCWHYLPWECTINKIWRLQTQRVT